MGFNQCSVALQNFRKTNLFLGRVNTFGQLTGQFVGQLIGPEELVRFLAVAAFLLL